MWMEEAAVYIGRGMCERLLLGAIPWWGCGAARPRGGASGVGRDP